MYICIRTRFAEIYWYNNNNNKNTSIGQLLDTSPKKFILFKTFNSKFSYIEVSFTDQNSKPLEIEDKKASL